MPASSRGGQLFGIAADGLQLLHSSTPVGGVESGLAVLVHVRQEPKGFVPVAHFYPRFAIRAYEGRESEAAVWVAHAYHWATVF